MADEEGKGGSVPVIIAMKGHPGTGKTTLARSLASTLKIPLIDKDDVRDSTLTLQEAGVSSSLLNDMSYGAIWQLASTQLRLGLSVVVDSPLSRRAHLDRLLQIATSGGARLVVVECRPADEDEWRRRLERRGGGEDEDEASWHKPSTWREMERLLESYDGCTDYDAGNVPKVVVDTTAGVAVHELVYSVVEFIKTHTTLQS
ncbi:putative P-loop containing nucleoside triphosphate hydrolase [Rosa chinensis]|uniref:Putative P-loop containing nucleoside triphosphate hydrolase n=1 Tax=Rosa chinensis TaxID=74649 RepID=A0A2P6S0F1_ROSCH|nr:putative P-loop containing nucleoside triphosphate hydrolase [Rosa chinensis]